MLGQIKQTSKTILFEQFTDSSTNLSTILSSEKVAEENKEEQIKRSLSVRSFSEFLEKFTPVFYQQMTLVDGKPKLSYTFENNGTEAIKITDHAFWNMVLDMHQKKSISGEHNLEFDYTEILEKLSPAYEMKRAKGLRQRLEYNFQKALEPNLLTSDRELYIQETMDCRQQIISLYQENPLNLLPLALNSTQMKLEALEKIENQNEDGIVVQQIEYVTPIFTETGEIDYIPVENKKQEQSQSESEWTVAKLLSIDFEEVGPENNKEFMKELVLTTFAGADSENQNQLSIAEQKFDLIQKKKQYQELYSEMLKSFIDETTRFTEKLLGVKIFFEEAIKSGKNLQSELIVTNCSIDALLQTENNIKQNFESYLKQVQGTPQQKYWLAIIPGVLKKNQLESQVKVEANNNDIMFGSVKSQNTVKSKKAKFTRPTFNEANEMLELLSDSEIGIVTFFNFKAEKATSLSELTVEKIEEYETAVNKCGKSNYSKEFMVFAYPNFTIIPDRNAEFNLLEQSIRFNGIYVDAAYVAAGVVAGYQNPNNLEALGYSKVEKGNPGTRFDLERDGNNFKYVTTLSRETSLNYAPNVNDKIHKDGFGFVMGSDLVYQGSKAIKNAYVVQARTLAKNDNNQYKKIYVTLTKNLLSTLLKSQTVKNHEDIKEFKSNFISKWRKQNESINSVLQQDENIDFIDNEVQITFGKEHEYMKWKVIDNNLSSNSENK